MAIRNQTGQIIERSGVFYVRHYDTNHKRVTARLCVEGREAQQPHLQAGGDSP